MNSMVSCGSIFLLVMALNPYFAHAQSSGAPDSLSFQGFVTNAGGVPIDNPSISVTFKLYEGSSEIWSETQPSVKIVGGVFNVLLGSVTPLDTVRFNRPLSLGITVGADPEISPRTPLAAAAYAKALPAFYTYYAESNAGKGHNVVGGAGNQVNSDAINATIGGGGGYSPSGTPLSNIVTGRWATIGGGFFNTAGSFATIGGGGNNTSAVVGKLFSTVGGGSGNSAGGSFATIGGGHLNSAGSSYATVPGGYKNSARGEYSFAAGYDARAAHEGTFVWNDRSINGTSNDSLASTGPNQFLIRAAGGVGIGTNSPSNQLTVSGDADVTGKLGIGTNTPSNELSVVGDADVTGNLGIGTNSPSNKLSVIGDADVAGKLGIGTNTPSNKLSVVGDADVTGNLGIGDTSPRAMVTVRGPNHATDGPIMFMYGDASDQVESGRIRFVEGTAPGSNRGAFIHYDGSANLLHIGTVDFEGTAANAITIRRDNRNVGLGINPSSKLHVNGNALAGAHTLPSDARLKKNVVPLENALGILVALRGVRFNWREEMGDLAGEGADIGVIAQEVAEVLPEVVHETGSGYLTVDYAKLVPVLIEAIKEQQHRIDEQERRLAKIEGLLSTAAEVHK